MRLCKVILLLLRVTHLVIPSSLCNRRSNITYWYAHSEAFVAFGGRVRESLILCLWLLLVRLNTISRHPITSLVPLSFWVTYMMLHIRYLERLSSIWHTRNFSRIQIPIIDSFTLLVCLDAVPGCGEMVFWHSGSGFIRWNSWLRYSIYDTKVEVLQLCETVLEKWVLRSDQLLTRVVSMLEFHGGWLILQAGHLKCFHHDLIMITIWVRLAVCVEANHFHWSLFILLTYCQLLLDWNLCAGSQLLNVISCCLLRYLSINSIHRGFLWCNFCCQIRF